MNNDSQIWMDKIIDLTIVSNNLIGKLMNWKVQNETNLNTDHSLISFDLGDNGNEEILGRFDFRTTNWVEWKKACTEKIKEWMERRR